jgi:eukaryotic-like serine/threonine-protein kinase
MEPLKSPSMASARPLGMGPGAAGGAMVGPYRLERALGRGGMGLVFLAHRADQQYEKRVAIKLLSGASREQALLRFRAERQILAKLDHPHIARMLDGGVTSDGEPYFVMDYVPGAEAIDDYCDQHKLSVRARVELFLDVCDAVHYAHRFLVVHRDLKPSNIQVSRDGVAKLVDFGIAKDLLSVLGDAVGGEGGEPGWGGATGTIAGRPMTAGYASPEQMRGDPIGTASDTYTLGVVLYELLVGRSPYKTDPENAEAFVKEVTTGSVVPMSRCYAQRGKPAPESVLGARGLGHIKQLERLLAGDLDAIVSKAMAGLAQDRYGSADQMADDLRRYLSGDMVSSVKHSTAYRARKFIQRYRGFSSAVFMVLAGSMMLAVMMAGVAMKNYLDVLGARMERRNGEEVQRFLVGAYEGTNPGAPAGVALSLAADKLGAFVPGEAAWKEQARLAVAETLIGAAAAEKATVLLEGLLTRNEKAYDSPNAERVREMALLGDAAKRLGRAGDAAGWYRRALDSRRELPAEGGGPMPSPQQLQALLTQTLSAGR